MELKSVKYWFSSLTSGASVAKAFKGKADIPCGLCNILFSHLVLALLMLAFVLSAAMNDGQNLLAGLLWPTGFVVIGVVSWLTRSYLYHLTASLVGGKGDYREYAALISFPMAGALVIGTALMLVFMLSVFQWVIVYLLLIVIPLMSIIQITEKQYGLSRDRALAAVIVPTALMILISVLLSSYGLAPSA
jgi:hypothetical protein